MRVRKKLFKILKIAAIVFGVIYVLFIITRLSGGFLTYVPFSGRIFHLSQEDVDKISIQSGTSGNVIEFTEPEERAEIIEKLKDLRYYVWLPDPSVLIPRGGWEYRFRFHREGETTSYRFGDNFIVANGFIYLVDQAQLESFAQEIP